MLAKMIMMMIVIMVMMIMRMIMMTETVVRLPGALLVEHSGGFLSGLP